MPRIFCVLITLFTALSAWGYPQFIGYKYASCVTCHFNPQGNGPLNDYGRALWAAEIAGRLWSGNRTDEQLGESSGFLGRGKLPWWLRPGIKARELYMITNPGGATKDSRSILMQADANVAIHFNKKQTLSFIGSLGYVPEPLRFQNKSRVPDIDSLISREHYFRWQAKDNLFLSLGMTDKVYGIRHVNHTAYSRARTGIAQNDQVHGIITHYIQPSWEIAGQIFGGNLFQDSDLRQKGFSMLYEKEIGTNWRLGGSMLASSNSYLKNTRYGLHSRAGLGYGSAVLFEIGIIDDGSKTVGSSKKGYYAYSEAIQKLTRGYHLFFTGQAYKQELKSGNPDNIRVGVGMLMFPMARWEFRVELENTRAIPGGAEIGKDTWAILGQLHMAL